MITLEWVRVADHKLERDCWYLVKWGDLLSSFRADNTKVIHLDEQGNWMVEGSCIFPPDYAFNINYVKHKATPKKFSIGDVVNVNCPNTQLWIGTIVAKRNHSQIWVVRDATGFGMDMNVKYLTHE